MEEVSRRSLKVLSSSITFNRDNQGQETSIIELSTKVLDCEGKGDEVKPYNTNELFSFRTYQKYVISRNVSPRFLGN